MREIRRYNKVRYFYSSSYYLWRAGTDAHAMRRSNKPVAQVCSPTRRQRRACTVVAGQRTTTREDAVVAASSSRLPQFRTPARPSPLAPHPARAPPTHTLPVPRGTVLYTAAAAHPDMLPLTLRTEASMLCFLENTCGWSSYMYKLHPSVPFPYPLLSSMRLVLVFTLSRSDVLTCDLRWRGCLPRARRSL